MDLFPSYQLVYEALQHHNLSDYMVYMMTKENWVLGLEKMVAIDESSGGVHFLMPRIHMQDLMDFDNDLLEDWVLHMCALSDYDYIVIDFSGNNISGMLNILKGCHCKVFTIREDEVGASKWQSFSNDLDKTGIDLLTHDARLISNNVFRCDYKPNYNYDLAIGYDDKLIGHKGKLSINTSSPTYKKMEVYFNDL